MSKFDQAGFLI